MLLYWPTVSMGMMATMTTMTMASTFYYQRQFQFLPHPTQLYSFRLLELNQHKRIVVRPMPSYRFYAVKGKHQGGSTISIGDTLDPEIRAVLELATDSELYELERILFGPSYLSPLLKSITKKADVDFAMIEEDLEKREEFMSMLESRFLYLAADARSTLRSLRPSYRDVLLNVRKKLNIRCSTKLSAEDLEAEIFLHLLQEYSSSMDRANDPDENESLEFGLSQWKIQADAALKGGQGQLGTMILRGGGMLTLGGIYKLLAKRLFGKCMVEAAKYGVQKELLKKGGELAAVNLEARLAYLVAKQGVKGAATRYLGLRSLATFFGPLLWGTFLADVFIQMLGTDYARIVRAIYAFAQIRITRSYKL
nr:uncharacterized protein LOC109175214 isoform X1 [Ipomoea batatas]